MPNKAIAIYLNYNGLRYLEYCLPAFQKSAKGKVDVLVVDSGSTDGSQAFLKKNYPSVKLIQLPKNLGWAGGNNAGIAYAMAKGYDYLFVLNTDTKVHAGFFDAIMKAGTRDKRAGIFGCKILYMGTKRLQAAGGGYFNGNALGSKQIGEGELDGKKWNRQAELDYIYEPAFAVKREVFEKVGLLDPEWFILMEGPDFCLRAKRSGYKTVYVPGAVVEHEVSGTTNPKKNSRASKAFVMRIHLNGARNGLRFMLKHRPFGAAMRYAIGMFADAVDKLLSKPHLLFLSFYSVLWNLVHLPSTLALRGVRREDYEGRYAEFINLRRQN